MSIFSMNERVYVLDGNSGYYGIIVDVLSLNYAKIRNETTGEINKVHVRRIIKEN